MSKSISQWTCTKSGGDSTRVIWKRSFKDGPKLEENEPITTKKSFSIQSPIRFLFRKLFFLSNRQFLQGFSRIWKVLCRITFCDFQPRGNFLCQKGLTMMYGNFARPWRTSSLVTKPHSHIAVSTFVLVLERKDSVHFPQKTGFLFLQHYSTLC